MAGSDYTPVVRRDLRIIQKPGGVYEVTSAERSTPALLYDIEIVVARLMDGTRTLKQVLAEAQRLGLPATADSVEKFMRQLDAYGFLKANGQPRAAIVHGPTLRDQVLQLWSLGRRPDALATLKKLTSTHPDDPSLDGLEALLLRQQANEMNEQVTREQRMQAVVVGTPVDEPPRRPSQPKLPTRPPSNPYQVPVNPPKPGMIPLHARAPSKPAMKPVRPEPDDDDLGSESDHRPTMVVALDPELLARLEAGDKPDHTARLDGVKPKPSAPKTAASSPRPAPSAPKPQPSAPKPAPSAPKRGPPPPPPEDLPFEPEEEAADEPKTVIVTTPRKPYSEPPTMPVPVAPPAASAPPPPPPPAAEPIPPPPAAEAAPAPEAPAAVEPQAAPAEAAVEGESAAAQEEAALQESIENDPAALARRVRRARVQRLLVVLVLGGIGTALSIVQYPLRVTQPCVMQPKQRAVVRSTLEVLISQVDVDEGETVRKDQLLARLSDFEFKKKLDKMDADLARAQAEMDILKRGARKEEIERARRILGGRVHEAETAGARKARIASMFAKHLASNEELEQASGELALKQTAVGEARASLHLLEAGPQKEDLAKREAEIHALDAERALIAQQLARTEIRSPIDGVVVTPRLREKVGTLVAVGAPVVEIVDAKTMRVEIWVPQSELDTQSLGLPVTVKVASLPSRAFVGKVTFISQMVEQRGEPPGEYVRVETEIDNGDGAIRPQMTGYAEIDSGRRPLGVIAFRGLVRWVRLRFVI